MTATDLRSGDRFHTPFGGESVVVRCVEPLTERRLWIELYAEQGVRRGCVVGEDYPVTVETRR